MDRSRLIAFVERHARGLMQRLGIPHWTLVFNYDLREDNGLAAKKAQCTRQINYNRARIELDPDQFDDDADEESLRVLRHELFHVVLSPFDLFYNAAAQLWADDPKMCGVLDAVWDHAVEKAVINLERMYQGLTINPAEEPAMGRQRAKTATATKTPTPKAPTPTTPKAPAPTPKTPVPAPKGTKPKGR